MRKLRFHLTRHAAMNLREIHTQSIKQWGQKIADQYLAEIYAGMARAAAKPDIGKLRATRAVPFLMVPAGKHFIVYDRLKGGIVILTLLHQRRDVEQIVAAMGTSFLAEIEALRKEPL